MYDLDIIEVIFTHLHLSLEQNMYVIPCRAICNKCTARTVVTRIAIPTVMMSAPCFSSFPQELWVELLRAKSREDGRGPATAELVEDLCSQALSASPTYTVAFEVS